MGLFYEAIPIVSNMFSAKMLKKKTRVDVVLDTKARYDLFNEARFNLCHSCMHEVFIVGQRGF